MRKVGKAEHTASRERWVKFAAWCRYNLLQMKVPRLGTPFIAKVWREQRMRLSNAVTAAVAKHYYEPLSPYA